ncbi:MAG: prolyl oligopeptidase family serine peptidase, partial [Pseudomonadota bacterium]
MRKLTIGAACAAMAACQSPIEETNLTQSLDTAAQSAPQTPTTAESINDELYLWMEEVEGDDALAWVRTQNKRSLEKIQGLPNYAALESDALEIATSKARIPYGSIRDGMVYNFWQDETNVRGLWRRTPLESYVTDAPDWETVLDFDALSDAEGANWVYKGANCFQSAPGERWVCMVSLSNGGKDAVIQREFDLQTKSFVEGGFETPEAKQGVSWVDYDTLLVGTDWGGDGGTLTESGYPSVVKRWSRGTPLEEAETLLSGDKTDVGVWPFVLETEDRRRLQGAVESDTFFTSKYFWIQDDGSAPVQWPIPPKSSPSGIYKGYFLLSLEQDWSPEGQAETFDSGDLVAFELDAFLETKTLPPVALVFRPNDRQAVNGVSVAKGAALLSINDNVAAKILKLDPGEDGWTTTPVDLPGAGQAGVAFSSKDSDTVFLNYEGFLTPDSLLRYDTRSGITSPLKALPEKFDVEGLTVSQFEATSTDGTKIPYFVVHRADIALDGTTPTLLYGYGGFQISLRPGYNATIGRLWLENGGAYVRANIRGGGEFGPDWHQAGLKQNRQRIYDDFIAVG